MFQCLLEIKNAFNVKKLAELIYNNYITQQQNAKSNGNLTGDKNSLRNKCV